MRRSIPAFAAALGLALTLTACGSSGDDGAKETTEPTADSATTEAALTGTLTMWVDETRIDVMKPIVEKFQSETGVKVDMVQKVSGDIRTDFVSQVPTGQGPPDVIIGAHDWTGEFVNNGVVAPPLQLGDKASEFSPSAVQAFTYDGQVYGAPRTRSRTSRSSATTSSCPRPRRRRSTSWSPRARPPAPSTPSSSSRVTRATRTTCTRCRRRSTPPIFTQTEDGSYTTDLGLGGENGEKFATYLQKLGSEKVLDPALGGDQVKEAFLNGEAPPYIVTGPPWYTTEFANAGLDISVLPPCRARVAPRPSPSWACRARSSRQVGQPGPRQRVRRQLPDDRARPDRALRAGRPPAGPQDGCGQGRRPDPRGLQRGRRDRRPPCPRSPRWARCGSSGGAPRRCRSSVARRPTRSVPGTRW